MKHIILTAVVAAVLAGTASADLLKGDPRVCRFGPDRKADCARSAAKTTLVVYMRTHGKPSFSNPVDCTPTTATLLKWRCDFGTGTATVWFRAVSTGWRRQVTVTMD